MVACAVYTILEPEQPTQQQQQDETFTNKRWYFHRIDCWEYIVVLYQSDRE